MTKSLQRGASETYHDGVSELDLFILLHKTPGTPDTKKNNFQTVENRQYRTVGSERQETDEMSFTVGPD